MLRVLLLFLLCLAGAAVALSWVRRRALGGGSKKRLGPSELKELARVARKSPPLERALALRRQIFEALEGREDRAGLRERVDRALLRLASQARLRRRIDEAVGAKNAVGGEVDEAVEAFEERQIMLGRLAEQSRTLERELERGALELSNLHLALLELSAAEAVSAEGALGEALGELESEGEQVRREREAEAEVHRFLESRQKSGH